MEPADDPEARIRELERPLADTAQGSELGPWPTDPLAPRDASAGFRPGWVLALIVAALMILGAVIAFFGVKTFTGGGPVTSGHPSVAGGGGRFGTPAVQPSADAPSIAEAPSIEPSIPSPPGPISVSGVRESRTLSCSDNSVSVSGVSNTVTITGRCGKVTVSGIQNRITLDAADTISASGFDNEITYHSGDPVIENPGGSNIVQQR